MEGNTPEILSISSERQAAIDYTQRLIAATKDTQSHIRNQCAFDEIASEDERATVLEQTYKRLLVRETLGEVDRATLIHSYIAEGSFAYDERLPVAELPNVAFLSLFEEAALNSDDGGERLAAQIEAAEALLYAPESWRRLHADAEQSVDVVNTLADKVSEISTHTEPESDDAKTLAATVASEILYNTDTFFAWAKGVPEPGANDISGWYRSIDTNMITGIEEAFGLLMEADIALPEDVVAELIGLRYRRAQEVASLDFHFYAAVSNAEFYTLDSIEMSGNTHREAEAKKTVQLVASELALDYLEHALRTPVAENGKLTPSSAIVLDHFAMYGLDSYVWMQEAAYDAALLGEDLGRLLDYRVVREFLADLQHAAANGKSGVEMMALALGAESKAKQGMWHGLVDSRNEDIADDLAQAQMENPTTAIEDLGIELGEDFARRITEDLEISAERLSQFEAIISAVVDRDKHLASVKQYREWARRSGVMRRLVGEPELIGLPTVSEVQQRSID